MGAGFDSTAYFLDLMVVGTLILPIFFVVRYPLGRRVILATVGIYLLHLIAPRLAIFYCLFWFFVFVLQQIIVRFRETEPWGQMAFWAAVFAILSPLVLWKLIDREFVTYFNLLGNQLSFFIHDRVGTIDRSRAIILPIGLSFAVFRAIDLLVKTNLGKLNRLGIDRIFYYGFFPPIQIVGPIIEYEELVERPPAQRPRVIEDVYPGFARCLFGLFKVLIIAAALQKSERVFYSYPNLSTPIIWTSLIVFTWFFYINFSGFSDIAIGLSRIFGIRLKENFDNPFFSRNVSEFWNRWHMSLSRFAQRNVFVPAGGYRPETQYRALTATMMVIALWHGLTWSLVAFGIFHSVGLIVHRKYSMSRRKSDPSNLRQRILVTAATYLFVTLSFPLLILNLSDAWKFYLAMIGQ